MFHLKRLQNADTDSLAYSAKGKQHTYLESSNPSYLAESRNAGMCMCAFIKLVGARRRLDLGSSCFLMLFELASRLNLNVSLKLVLCIVMHTSNNCAILDADLGPTMKHTSSNFHVFADIGPPPGASFVYLFH